MSWFVPLLHLEVVVMFQHLTCNPYDEWKISKGAVRWAEAEASYLRSYRKDHAPRLATQDKERQKRKRYNAGEAMRALVLAQDRARAKRYAQSEAGRAKRNAASRRRRILRRQRIAEIAQARQ